MLVLCLLILFIFLRNCFPTMVWVLCRDWKLGVSPPYPETPHLSQLVQWTSHRLSLTNLQPWICRYTKEWIQVCLHRITTASENLIVIYRRQTRAVTHFVAVRSLPTHHGHECHSLFKLFFPGWIDYSTLSRVEVWVLKRPFQTLHVTLL